MIELILLILPVTVVVLYFWVFGLCNPFKKEMKSRLFIIEGPDSSGKTTLAKYLAVRYSGTYLHMSGFKSLHDCMPAYHDHTLRGIEWTIKNIPGSTIILDRSWPSEFVYGREFRPQYVDTFPYKEFQKRISDIGGVYVFCMDDGVEERHQQNHEDVDHKYDPEPFKRIVDCYRVLMAQMELRPDVRQYNMIEWGSRLDVYANNLWTGSHPLAPTASDIKRALMEGGTPQWVKDEQSKKTQSSKEQRQDLHNQWVYHIGHCDNCKGYPELCQRGKQIHQELFPEDWKDGKPTR